MVEILCGPTKSISSLVIAKCISCYLSRKEGRVSEMNVLDKSVEKSLLKIEDPFEFFIATLGAVALELTINGLNGIFE